MPAHRLRDDAAGACVIWLMHYGVLTMEHPLVRVCPLNPHASFVAGDDPRRAKNHPRLVDLDFEGVARTNEHVHKRALAHREAESVTKHKAQPLVGKRLKALEIDRQRVNARPERRRRGDGGRRSLCLDSTRRATAGIAPVTDDIGLHRRYLDLVVFADQVHIDVGGEGSAAAPAHGRLMVAEFVGLVRQAPVVRLMPGLRAARTGLLPLLFLVSRRRLRGGARRLSGTLKREHKLDQFFPAQALQINAIHAPWIQRLEPVARGWVIAWQ